MQNDCSVCRFGYRGAATCGGMRPNRHCLNCKPIPGLEVESALPEPPIPRANLRDPEVRALYEEYRLEQGIRYGACLTDGERAAFDRYVHRRRTRPSA